MPVVDMILIALAGVAAGAINAVVGSGTLVTFPTLVALGYPPVTSTMSNAVGLVAGSMSGTWGYRRELRGQWNRLAWQLPASFLGAGLGAWLLLHLPETVFHEIVPVLLVLALVLVVVGPGFRRGLDGGPTRPYAFRRALLTAVCNRRRITCRRGGWWRWWSPRSR